MKKYAAIGIILGALILGMSGVAHAQTLYNQSGEVINAFDETSKALTPGWYYGSEGQPLYYYANGAYYNPSTQSYGGEVLYPNADGPTLGAEAFTPGVPNTGLGGRAFLVLLSLLVSAGASVLGTYYLNRAHLI